MKRSIERGEIMMGYCSNCKCRDCERERYGRRKGYRAFLEEIYHPKREAFFFVLEGIPNRLWEDVKDWILEKDPYNISFTRLEENLYYEAADALKNKVPKYAVCRLNEEKFDPLHFIREFNCYGRRKDYYLVVLTNISYKLKAVEPDGLKVIKCEDMEFRRDEEGYY